jgi:hypothetical protein
MRGTEKLPFLSKVKLKDSFFPIKVLKNFHCLSERADVNLLLTFLNEAISEFIFDSSNSK